MSSKSSSSEKSSNNGEDGTEVSPGGGCGLEVWSVEGLSSVSDIVGICVGSDESILLSEIEPEREGDEEEEGGGVKLPMDVEVGWVSVELSNHFCRKRFL